MTTIVKENQANNDAAMTITTNVMNQSEKNSNQEIVYFLHTDLRPTPMGNYRKRRNAQEYKETLESVEAKGFLQNIVIRRSPIDGKPEVVAGYGRWEMAKDLTEKYKDREFLLPCLDKGVITDQECLELALAENSKRSNHTISDQIDLAREYYGIHTGDLKLSALKLGLSEGVFRELLHLGACCEPLLDNLDDPDSPIQKGHCSILRNFPESIQLDTLKTILSDPKTYTVAYLKKQAASFEFALNDAKFDTSDCSSCPHNSGGAQSFMFADAEDNKCSNPPCYTNKSKLWLANTRIPQLEEKHGTVLTTEQKPLDQIKYCAAELLGQDQVNDCKNCSDCVVLVNSSPDDFGSAWGGVCINTTCHSELEAKFKRDIPIVDVTDQVEVNSAPVQSIDDQSESQISDQIVANEKPNVGVEKAEEIKSTVETGNSAIKSNAKLSKKLQRTYANMIQSAFVPSVSANQSVALAIIAKSLGHSLRNNQVKESIDELSTKSPEDLNLLIQSLIGSFYCQSVLLDSDAFDTSGFNANEVVRKCFVDQVATNEEKENIIRNSWIPTKDLLGQFTIEQLSLIASQSGYDVVFNESKGNENAWSKQINSSKGKVIDAMLSIEFDWTHYAPKSYIKVGMEYSKPA